MKKRLREYKVNTIKKKFISLSTAAVLLMGDIPASGISSLIGKVTSLFSTSASADGVTYYNKTEYTKTYADTGYIHIESWADFVWYSQSYFNYTYGKYTTTIEHEKDVLYINIKDSIANNYDLSGKDYVPIGNDLKPFEGRLIFTSTSADTFNVPQTLFGTVSEKVTIKNQDESAVKQINLTRTGAGNGDALFAQKVVTDDNSSTHSDWNIVLDKFDNSSAVSYAGLIGEIDATANVELTYANNALSGKSDILATASNYSGGKPADAGALCGKMGAGATLTATYSGANTNYNITSDNGNAGGLVGSMGLGSVLTVTASNLQGNSAWVSASNGYAGGIVGKNDGGTVSITPSSGTSYAVSQIIHGKNGTGGLFGYYSPPSAASTALDISKFTVNCKLEQAVSETGVAGGIIGVVENVPTTPAGRTGGSLTISGASDGTTAVISNHVSQTDSVTGNATGYKAEAYGGLIGSYIASDTGYSLNIKDVATTPANTLAASNYGGGIGKISGASYVKFQTFKLNSAAGTRSETFGGLVADCPKGYIYADGSTTNTNCTGIVIGSSAINVFTGGGLVGNLGDGVLGMNGTINLSNAQPTASDENGIIVGKRDNALIYVDGSWTYTPNAAEVDNVGSWGDVLVIDGTKLKKDTTSDSLNVFNESNHIITIGNVTTTAIANAADYAKASLLYQIDVTKNSFINNTSSLTSSSSVPLALTFTNDIDLTGTSLRGITRDNGTSRVSYSGTISGGHQITLDIKNVGGTNRPVYRKKYIGMLGIADTATINNTSFSGSILSKNVRNTSSDTTAYLGSAAAQVKTSFTASNCNTAATLNISMTGTSDVISGRLIGQAVPSMGNITISGSNYDGIITGNNKSTVGGTIGKIAGAANSAVWSFDGITLKGSVKGVQNVGGLISDVIGEGKATIRLGNTDSVVADNSLYVEGNSDDSMGGLLGYSWSKADVEVTDVEVSGNPTVHQKKKGGTAGLVYRATGHWTVTKLYLGYTDSNSVSHAIKMLTSTAKSVGMIVNQGKNSTDGIYLELPSKYDYKLALHGDSTFKSDGVFDEICAYSADSASKIMTNGQGIVSISTTGLVMGKSNTAAEGESESLNYTDSLSYKNQTVHGKYKNGNTRYYYNLDTIDIDNTLSDSDYAKKLMRWGVRQYACTNIQEYFPDPFTSNTIPAGTYNIQGYSWYPVTPLYAMTVNGTFTFYNEEFDECEKVKGKHANITNDSDKNIWSPLESDQHYMMQNGLFYNVTKNLTISAITLKGTIGAIDSTSGTGALVYGTASGTADANGTTIISSSGGSISLDGVKIWNLDSLTGDSIYAPLLINQASDYVTFNIEEVSTTSSYRTSDTTTPAAATSLIGKAGTRDTATEANPISQGISVTFKKIKLDGRNAENNTVYDKDRYNTTKSIFTKATLLEQLIGSAGTYNFDYDTDWGTGTPHKVTYGRELGYTTTGQYPNQELWYENEKVTGGKQRYVRPDSAPPASGSSQYPGFTDSSPFYFLPYVANVSTKDQIKAKTGFKYQLMVNHQPSDRINGCGTYNDPYIITSATDLVNISKFINSDSNLTGTINVDDTKDGWCNAIDADHLKAEHIEYTLGTSTCTTTVAGKSSMTANEMRKYLASAYYQINLSGSTTLELASDSGFLGLGTKGMPFCGVIDGGSTVKSITNKTTYSLINYSNGSVVRNISIKVQPGSDISLPMGSNNCTVDDDTKYKSYGGVISKVMGGDNIIDNVSVDYSSMTNKFVLANQYSQLVPIGGYIGVIYQGGVIFRNMSSVANNFSDTLINVTNSTVKSKTSTSVFLTNKAWLYINPYIGRVINGFAVYETSVYRPYELGTRTFGDNSTDTDSNGHVTLQNGTKHYSITDIKKYSSLQDSDKLGVTSGYAITIPDAQSFFLMSLMVSCGMSTSSGLGYYSASVNSTNQTSRSAEYNDIGSEAVTSSACDDYYQNAKNDGNSSNAYLIQKYTTSSSAANAKTMANQKAATITLSEKTYVLPDGYKGIGNIFNNYDNYRLKVATFTGSGAIISQNTSYLYYNTSADNKYFPVNTQNVNGLGLFNCQTQAGNYSYFTLKGNLTSDIVDWQTTNGAHVAYTDGVLGKFDKSPWVQAAGLLFGCSNANQKINSVALVNVNVHGAKFTGGMIGNIPASNTTITNDYSLSSSLIKVSSGMIAGGIIGRNQQGVLDFNFNNCTYSITEVKSECTAMTDAAKYAYGVGGLIGICRGNGTYKATVKNVKIGSTTQPELSHVKCEKADIYTGGLFGVFNRTYLELENCEINNLSVEAQFAAGGLVGHWATSGDTVVPNYTTKYESKIKNTTLNCNLSGAKIHSTGIGTSSDNKKYCAAGGLFGSCKCDMANVYVENCTVKNYDIYGVRYSGGIVGSWGDSSTSYTVSYEGFDHIFQLNNIEVSGCNITSDFSAGFAGGLAGHLDVGYTGKQKEKYDLYGYNILAKNLSFSANKQGYICGDNEAPSRNMIKLVAFSRQNTDDSKVMIQDTVGDGGYGDYGYVVFADYMGTASYTENNDGTKTPGANSSGAFSNMTSTSTSVTPAAPYVTTSPKTNIANKNDVMQFVLSDGASPLTTATVGRSTEAFANIYADIANTNAGYYSLPASYLDTAEEYSAYTNKISSFKTEMGTNKNLANGIDFPVLVLDNINKSQMTEFINKYISLLTNTTTSSVSGGKYNFAENASGVYSVVLKRVTFNSAGTAISEISDSSICLKKDNGQFYIEANDTDTKATTAQFTLIDVQFYDPSATTTVAYHLYIPCYVRKLVEYDFDIHVDSGTSYDIHSYDSLVENSLVENIGTPITLEFAFTYNRTADEWTVAANSGDSLLSNFSKDLLFDNATAVSSGTKPNFPTTTRMVLIDTQNSSKSYYLDGLSDTSFVPDGNYRNLKLDQFTSLDSQSFAPVDLNEMLDVTVTAADDGTLVADNNNATVKDTHTNTKYRLATDAESTNGNITKYSATVSFKNGATKLSEHYFLTIYTPYSETDVVYHYAIQANKSLGTTPYPSRITAESETHAVNLYVGYIYNNNVFIDSLKVNDTENEVVITKENNSIEASIHATIGLTSSGEANIRPTLSGDSPPDIYQSFLIKLNKDGDIGLAAVDSVTVSDYIIGGKSVTHRDLNPSWNSADYTDIEIPNYIQLRNGVPLANALSQVAENQTLTISAKATLEFNYDKGDITKQFFPQTSNKYTTFVAYSNIASSSSQTASSKVSAMNDVKVDGSKPQYYTLIEEKATLNYDALEIASEGYLPQLGINANDPDDNKKLPSTIKTVGSYNVENCTSAWENANYLKIEIELKSKADNYVEALDIFDYLQESSFKIFDGEFTASTDTTSKKLVYIINKDALNSYYKDKVYQIPIEFKVYSGGGSANNFESQSRQYSTYGVFLKVSMLQASNSISAVTGTEPEYNNNYVKYTNARIYLDKVNPNKAAS